MTAPPQRRSLTLLHLSDPQFGRHHRPARGDTDADREHDTLRARLLQDLAELRDGDEPVRPELVVVTGDLSEWARRSELTQFEAFATGLLEGLGLPPERLVMVPGNHDVSWKACEAYFNECEAEEEEPRAPYWPKWRFYAELFERYYGTADAPFEFNEARPWSLFVYEPLRTVVAGLNSTMPETHREGDHHGGLGEDQLRWFAEQLRPYRERGWLRIAAVHHNVQRKAVDDDENLRDAPALDQLLGDHVNLVLHGHAHDGKLGWLRAEVPLLSTGSAAVKERARPHGVPCQYQVLRMHEGGVRRLTRAYAPSQQRWVGDTAASADGNDWRHDHPVRFVDLHGIFPPPEDDDDQGDPLRLDPRRMATAPGDFLTQLADICRLREPHTTVVRRRRGPPFIEYLELRRQQGDQVEVVPMGGDERGVDEATLDAFVQRVAQPHRRRDRGARCEFVYGGPPASTALVERARAAGVWLRSYEQHCGLIDFRQYRSRLIQRLARDQVYPSDKYVGQRMVEHLGREHLRHEQALDTVRRWLDDENGRFVLVLGTFGTGKTFLLRQLARRLAEDDGAVVPILVEMRSLEKGLRLEQLLAQHFALHEVDDYSPARFLRMLEDGRVALLFDGFDELVVRSTYARAAEHFETIVSAARGRAKVVVTSRRQHFLSDHQAKEAARQVLMQKVEVVPGHRVVTLLPFEDDQIERFLAWHLGDVESARERMRLIAEVRDLSGLSANPRMLGFIAALSEDELRAARDQQGSVSAAGLYRSLLERWLAFEQDRRHPRGAAPGLDVEARWTAVTELAVRLWTRGEHHVVVDELEELGAVLVELAKGSKEEAGFQIGSGTLLVRDDEGRFSFIHESVLEWLVARAAAQALREGPTPALLGRGKISQLLADFLIDLAGASAMAQWCARALTANLGNATADNALMVRQRLAAAGLSEDRSQGVDLTGQDLRGRDLSGQWLPGARMAGADLRGANLRGTVLVKTQLRGARLSEADLSGANLSGCDLQDADLVEASLLGADLRGARLTGADLSRAKLLGAYVDEGSLAGARLVGTARPHDRVMPLVEVPLQQVHALALSPDLRLLAIADDRHVRLWDLDSGRELRRWTPRGESVTAMAFRDDGEVLAAGTRDGGVTCWRPGEGEGWRTETHPDRIVGLAFDPQGRLASLSKDGLLHWGRPDGSPRGRWRPPHRAHALAVSPDGQWLAVGDGDGRIHMLDERLEIRRLIPAHDGLIRALAFSPSGDVLASSAGDTAKLWKWPPLHDPLAGSITTFPHPRPVSSLTFVDDDFLLTGAWDGAVRLWDLDGQCRTTDSGSRAAVTALIAHRRYFAAASGASVHLYEAEAETSGAVSTSSPAPTPRFGLPDSLGPVPRPGPKALAAAADGSLCFVLDGQLRTISPVQRIDAPLLDLSGSQPVALSRDGLGVAFARGPEVSTHRFFPRQGTQGLELRCQLHEAPTHLTFAGPGSARLLAATPGAGGQIHELSPADDSVEYLGTVGPVDALASSPDGGWIAAACSDYVIRVLGPLARQTPTSPIELAGHRGSIISLDVSHDPPRVVSSGLDGAVRLWEPQAGRECHTWSLSSEGGACVVRFGPDDRVVAGGFDGRLRLWSTETRESVATVAAHHAAISTLAFPAETLLATGSRDRTIKLWRLPSLTLLATLAPLPEGWVAFAPDGRYKTGGRLAGQFWHAAAGCRFEVGELDEFIDRLRVPDDESLFEPGSHR